MDDSGSGLSLNDETDYGLCFVCGPRNESGLRLRFERDGDAVTTSYKASGHHQGFPGVLHGGVLSALLDEVMSRVSVVEGRWTQTARMEVRFRRPVPVDSTVTAVGRKTRERWGFIEAEGRVLLADGSVAAEASGTFAPVTSGTFAPVTNDALAEMSSGYPRLSREWMVNKGRGCGATRT